MERLIYALTESGLFDRAGFSSWLSSAAGGYQYNLWIRWYGNKHDTFYTDFDVSGWGPVPLIPLKHLVR